MPLLVNGEQEMEHGGEKEQLDQPGAEPRAAQMGCCNHMLVFTM